jgi:hypothetical protein
MVDPVPRSKQRHDSQVFALVHQAYAAAQNPRHALLRDLATNQVTVLVAGAGGTAEEKKSAAGLQQFLEEKLTKDYGSCTPISAP